MRFSFTRRSTSAANMSPFMRFFFSRIFPLIFVVVGAGVGVFGFRGLLLANASTGWPTTPGEVKSAAVEYRSSSEGGGTYHAEIRYDFRVDGVLYSGDRVAYGDYGSSNASHARKIVNGYPKGAQVAVHYMPDDPEECLLEPGVKAQAFFAPVFGLLFFGAGGLMALRLPRAMRGRQRTRFARAAGRPDTMMEKAASRRSALGNHAGHAPAERKENPNHVFPDHRP